MSLRERIPVEKRRLVPGVGVGDFGPTKTQQHQAKETDINVIVARFGVTGKLPLRLGTPIQNANFDGVFDYMSAQNAIVAADRAFKALPSKTRLRFGNDPRQFVEFCSNPENLDELRKMGLADAEKVPEPEKVQKVEIVAGAAPPKAG